MTNQVPIKYIPKSLSNKDKNIIKKSLRKSRKLYKTKKYYVRPKVTSYPKKESKHITNAKKLYNVDKIKPSKQLSKKTGCSIKALNDIVKKGEGAYFSSGSRPNQTPQSWGYARLASAITGAKSAVIDWHIIQNGCKKNSKTFKLAKKALQKYGKKTRSVPKTKL